MIMFFFSRAFDEMPIIIIHLFDKIASDEHFASLAIP